MTPLVVFAAAALAALFFWHWLRLAVARRGWVPAEAVSLLLMPLPPTPALKCRPCLPGFLPPLPAPNLAVAARPRSAKPSAAFMVCSASAMEEGQALLPGKAAKGWRSPACPPTTPVKAGVVTVQPWKAAPPPSPKAPSPGVRRACRPPLLQCRHAALGLPLAHGMQPALACPPIPEIQLTQASPGCAPLPRPAQPQAQKQLVRTARARAMIEAFHLPFEPLAELVRPCRRLPVLLPLPPPLPQLASFGRDHAQRRESVHTTANWQCPPRPPLPSPSPPCCAQLRRLGCLVAGGSMLHAYMGSPLHTFAGDLDIFAKPVSEHCGIGHRPAGCCCDR